jgi:arsenate reductase (thioredoxin)
MKLFDKLMTSSTDQKKRRQQQEQTVLFICVQNAARSQMAEGFFRKYVPRGFATLSAGTNPSGEINPLAVQVMREIGIDISNQKSKIITDDMIRNSSKIVNMGCIERKSCPTLFIYNLIDWDIEDPKGKSIDKVREIRDVIEERVRQLAADLLSDNTEIKL